MTRSLIRFNIIMALKCVIVFEVHARAQEKSSPERIEWIAILSTWICSCVVFDCSIIDGIRCGKRASWNLKIFKYTYFHTRTFQVEHQHLTTQPYHLWHYIKVINYFQLRKLGVTAILKLVLIFIINQISKFAARFDVSRIWFCQVLGIVLRFYWTNGNSDCFIVTC